ncbi:hypothetical protein CALCODRAFT_489198, partial [Calocera cornea HHB12733]
YRAALVAPKLAPRPDNQKYPRRLKNSELVLRHPDVTPAARAHYKRYPELTNDFFNVVEDFLDGCAHLGNNQQLASPKGTSSTAEAAAHVANVLCKAAGKMLALNNVLMVASLLGTTLEYDSYGAPLVPAFMQENTWGRKKPPTRTDIFRPIFLAACYSPIALLVDLALQWEPLPLHSSIDTWARQGHQIPYDPNDEEAAGAQAITDFVWREIIGGLGDLRSPANGQALTGSKIETWAKGKLKLLAELRGLFFDKDDLTVPESQLIAVDWPDRAEREHRRLTMEEAQAQKKRRPSGKAA